MRFGVVLAFAGVATMSHAQVFSPEQRAAVIQFWSKPERYTTTIPSDATTKGLWQVRLTVAGSKWLWDYQKGKKIPPTATVVPQTDEQKQWESWIQTKLARDRWQALRTAQDANEKVIGKRVPEPDKDTPGTEPPVPGPAPESLLAAVGNPPPFAEAVVPMMHSVVFEDATIAYRDNTRLGNPRYAYYRFEKGVMSGGVPVKALPAETIARLCSAAGISDSEAKVMRAVSMLEGGFDSVNTYDTGYVSIGFIQFASLSGGSNSLGALLKMYKQTYPEDYRQDFQRFGVDCTPDGALAVLDLATSAELTAGEAAAKIIEDKRLIAVFQRAGLRSEKFNAMQLKAARDLYLPTNDTVSLSLSDRTLTGTVADVIRSEAGMAVLMDRKVNTGKIDLLTSILTELAAEINPQKLADFAPYEKDIVAALKYRKDYLTDSTLSQPAASPSSRWASQASRGGATSRNSRGGIKG